ncbi:MAG: aminomethyl-transferring glycine dehydrogenase subunit GcvPA [Alphaproteobacteria bacterium]|nr:aminomethyl-transferring glycine dehydrogenase subunit GcvPA [Alphaproteobacteria bacterium]
MRYLPLTPRDRAHMLRAIGVPSIDALYDGVPAAARRREALPLPAHQGEIEVERHLAELAACNLGAGRAAFFLGAGAYRHHVPAAVDHLIQRSEFLTSYTPYQPEISQGTLQYLFEFQTQVALLTGMEVANASLYDGATATSEAVLMAARLTRRHKAVLSGGLHPHYRDTVATLTDFAGFRATALPADADGGQDLVASLDGDTACLVVQNPDVFGRLHDLEPLAGAAQARGALLVAVVNEPVSLGLVRSPGEMGADIVAAEGQGLGGGLNFGGPHLGLFATRERFVRQMPGRLCGETVDADGRRGYVLTLSTREQHIRREKATSNICTNSGLMALAFTIHLSLLGEAGLRRLAELNHAKAVQLADRLAGLPGVRLANDSFFNEFTLRLGRPAAPLVAALAGRGVLAGVPGSRLWPERADLADLLLVCASECTTAADMTALVDGLKEALR